MIEKRFVRVKVGDLVPYENNPRNIPEEAVADVMESIKQCGDGEPLDPIEIDEDNVILAGHTRRLAFLKAGIEETDCVQYLGMTDEQKRKYRILANKTGERSGWNFTLLDEELGTLDFDGYDFGFDVDELDLDGMFEESDPTEKEEKLHEVTCPCCGETFMVNSSFEPQ